MICHGFRHDKGDFDCPVKRGGKGAKFSQFRRSYARSDYYS
jgi:hypothetical protein